jgi:hypothetical protein
MNARKTLIALGIAAGSLAALGATPALADIYVRVAPPAPRYEAVPTVQPGWIWQPGYWNWNGHRYIWAKGHRVRAHRGAHWVAHAWHEEGGRWRMDRGHWDRD